MIPLLMLELMLGLGWSDTFVDTVLCGSMMFICIGNSDIVKLCKL